MQVRILGPVDVTVDGVPREVRGFRRKAVLAVLALRATEIVSAGRLIEVVWGERAPRTAVNTLQKHVSYLREVLGGRTAIVARPPGYALGTGTDLLAAQGLIEQARRCADPGEQAVHLRAALACWRDRPLVDVAGPAWLDEQAERITRIRSAAVDALTEARLALGEHALLVPELEQRSRRHPFHEHVHRQLMLALYRSGRQADALAAYQRLRHNLGEELGIDPSPALRDLEAAILRQDATLAPPRTAVRAARDGGPELLERADELAGLAAAVREAVAGKGSVALVSGEPGAGKSALVDAVHTMLPERARLLVGRCDDLATPRTLGPLRDLAGSVGTRLAGALRADGARDEVLSALHEELAGSPTVLVVEDVHWADEATVDALSFLVKRVAGLPVLLLLTCPPGGQLSPRLLGQVAAARRVRRFELAPLSAAAVARLVAPRGLDPAEVYAATGGNPFFVTEILAAGHLDRVPPTVADAVLARLHRLDRESQAAVAQLAVVPSGVERWLLDALLPGSVRAVVAAEEHGLLTVTSARTSFRHALIRRTVVDALPVARRVALNRRVLTALVGREGTDLARVVHHAAEAGAAAAVVRYGPPAAEAASRAGAHREAAAHLRLVLRHRERLTAGRLADLLGRYAVECGTTSDVTSALDAQKEAVELRRGLGDARALGADLVRLSRLCWQAGEPELLHSSADEAVTLLETAGDDRLLAHALGHQSGLRSMAGHHHESIRIGERAIALARATGDQLTLTNALTSVGAAQGVLGLPEAWDNLEEARRVALAAGSVGDYCRFTCAIVGLLLEEHRHDEAMRYVTTAIELADGAEQVRFLHHMHAYRAMVAAATSDWDLALADAGSVLEARPPVKPPTRCPALTVLGLVRIRRGLPGGAEALAEAWELAQRTGELQHIGPVAAARAEAAWLRGDDADPVLESVRAHVHRRGGRALAAELGFWLGAEDEGDPGSPYAMLAAGRWRAAAELWQKAGCAYEHAVALAESTDPGDLASALTTLDALAAAPLANRVRARLRELA